MVIDTTADGTGSQEARTAGPPETHDGAYVRRVVDSPGPSFVDAVLAAPVGVALLAWLEAAHRRDVASFEPPPSSDGEAVERAARSVRGMSWGEIAASALDAATALAGPWTAGAPRSLAVAYGSVGPRRSIAESVSERFGAALHAAPDLVAQQWWHSNTPKGPWVDGSRFAGFDRVYGCGEFTFDGLWTVTDPPPETHDLLVGTWEIFPGPTSRWRLPVRPGVRLWEIHRPADWARLVETYPGVAAGQHEGWELPGPNQHKHDVDELLSVPGQHAARRVILRHLVPNWAAVAADYDGVHLSWAGFITTEGHVCDLGAGAVAMLRYWGSERTLWLKDVFGDPEPLAAPVLSGRMGGDLGVDVRADQARQRQDLEVVTALLGR